MYHPLWPKYGSNPGPEVSFSEKDGSIPSHMLHGAGIFTNICPKNHPDAQCEAPQL